MTEAHRGPLRIALTGGAGSGKSAVARRLAESGITVIDTDTLAREVVEPGEAGLEAVVAVFGEQVLNQQGRLDRAALRDRILDSEQDRGQLEAILHPLIMDRLKSRLAQAEGPYAVAEIPLLAESGHGGQFDRIITVEAPRPLRIQRLMTRDGVDEAAAERLVAAQASETERRAIADWVIDNDGDLDQLHLQVDKLDQALRNECR
ncbi:dephospho-CoA kinase [Natronospira proteinivora]|uniref:Dephospho-CoA kinase n=1 Tax=Natronospira proteinivora TaxID=1807133 RepID=A0ABT1G4A2_9GAMM|nr:dephospho-CoA kinase [Natronospira proteinivora]MCP1726119.1 dephospho-CoA kinase [Natronospira proteinivora]